MNKKIAFTITELAVVLGLIILTALLVIPNLIEDNKKLDSISKWKNYYQNIEYVFSALKIQVTDKDIMLFRNAKNKEQKEKIFFELINPYFRITETVNEKNYKVRFLNGTQVKPDDYYYISKLYKTSSGRIIGFKCLDTSENSQDKMPFAILTVDLNGINKPNKWGVDIFGINIYRNKFEPIGKSNDELLMESDCTKKGKGISCSYYYYIYGGKLN